MNKYLPLFCLLLSSAVGDDKPNLVIIFADDLEYENIQCYNPERGKTPTPHIDELTSRDIRFTDAHSSSGICTAYRYALLSECYHWPMFAEINRTLVGSSPDHIRAEATKRHRSSTV